SPVVLLASFRDTPTFWTAAAIGPITRPAVAAATMVRLLPSGSTSTSTLSIFSGPKTKCKGNDFLRPPPPSKYKPLLEDQPSTRPNSVVPLRPLVMVDKNPSPAEKSIEPRSVSTFNATIPSAKDMPAVRSSRLNAAPSIDRPVVEGLPISTAGD